MTPSLGYIIEGRNDALKGNVFVKMDSPEKKVILEVLSTPLTLP